MSDTDAAEPVDPMDDPARHGAAPSDDVAIDAAQRMNEADGPQPGVVSDAPEPGDDEPLPEVPG